MRAHTHNEGRGEGVRIDWDAAVKMLESQSAFDTQNVASTRQSTTAAPPKDPPPVSFLATGANVSRAASIVWTDRAQPPIKAATSMMPIAQLWLLTAVVALNLSHSLIRDDTVTPNA